jgi:hypothetical protein
MAKATTMENRGRQQRKQRHKSKIREVFSVRFSEDELDQLRSEADVRGTSIAGTVRKIVMDTLSRPRVHAVMLGANTVAESSANVYGEIASISETRTAS